jgi:hypothetical protein
MDIIKKYNNAVKNKGRRLRIDKTHGADAFGKVIKPLYDLYEGKGINILATGREQERVLSKNRMNYVTPYDFYNIVNSDEKRYRYQMRDDFKTSDLLLVWLANYMEVPFINELKDNLGASLVTVGDSFLVDYFSDGNVISYIQNSDIEMNKIDNIKDYSQELVYFINRIRNGEVDKLENSVNRSYEITNKKPNIEELFEYDKVVTSSLYVGQTNRYIREMIFKNYEMEPVKGDKMIAYEPIQVRGKDDERITVDFGEELTVVEKEIASNGCLIVTFLNKDDKEIRIWIDYKWLATRYGEDGSGYPKGGYKMFYSFVVPPEAMIDNSYESVFFEIKSGGVNNKRVLYSVGSSARQKLKVVYSDEMSYLY